MSESTIREDEMVAYRLTAERAYAIEGPCRSGETHGIHVLRVAAKAAALTALSSERDLLRERVKLLEKNIADLLASRDTGVMGG